MTRTFRDYTEGRLPMLKLSPGLVQGWLVEAGDREVCYALYSSGRVLRIERWISSIFTKEGEKWTEVQEVPANAEFVGNYPPPMKED